MGGGMKRVFCLLGLVALCACDRPQYDVQLLCTDGTLSNLLVDAKVYESHADLVVKRLDKELRYNTLMSIGNPGDQTWLADQLPQIDDTVSVSLPVTDMGVYELPNKVRFETVRDNLTGGVNFILWHTLDETGVFKQGYQCDVVVSPIDIAPENMSDAQLKEIKNCMNYIENQWSFVVDTPMGEGRHVFDEKTGRTMYIYEPQIKEIFGDIEPSNLFLSGLISHNKDIVHACDVAQRLHEYIQTHIDSEYIRDEK